MIKQDVNELKEVIDTFNNKDFFGFVNIILNDNAILSVNKSSKIYLKYDSFIVPSVQIISNDNTIISNIFDLDFLELKK